jgi:phage virion morphogenesis protein
MANKTLEQARTSLLQVLRTLPRKVGNLAVVRFQGNFKRQGFGEQPWQPRKPPGRKLRRSDRRAILVKSGRLRRSIRVVRTGSNSVVIGSDVEYAAVHNEGLKAGRGKGFTMPRRQFMGMDTVLKKEISDLIESEMKRVFG